MYQDKNKNKSSEIIKNRLLNASNISEWDKSNVIDAKSMFSESQVNNDISDWLQLK